MRYPKAPIERRRTKKRDVEPFRPLPRRLSATHKAPLAALSVGSSILLLVGLSVGPPSHAQSPPVTQAAETPDDKLAKIQAKADSVEEHIATISAQERVVTEAFDSASALSDQLRRDVRGLRLRIKQQQEQLERFQGRAEAIATELYKAGPTAELEPLLEASTIAEVSEATQYLGQTTALNSSAMIRPARLKEVLEEDQRFLEAKLTAAREARQELSKRAQHLQELRKAKEADLGQLQRQIRGLQQEMDALAGPSAAIANQLSSSSIPASNVGGFAWPFGGSVTSGYGPRWGRMHTGIDIDCSSGDPIRASKSGTVVTATYDDGYGNHLIVDHGGGYASLYAHNTSLAVSSGQQVSQGQIISTCGATGNVTGDHLHFEIRVNGSPQDPMAYLP